MNLKQKPKIAIIDDDRDIVEVTSAFLVRNGYDVLKAYEGISGLAMVLETKPDLVLLDLMLPGLDGYEICKRIKEDSNLWHVPVIYFTAKGAPNERISGLSSGADDYVTKPFEPGELLARINRILFRTSQVLDANPLTTLPGNHSIQLKISQSFNQKEKFAIFHIDIDHFKSFNDQYGFQRGDKAIRKTGRLLTSIVRRLGDMNDFVGHIGGDDFVVVTTPDKIDTFCNTIIKEFDDSMPKLYDAEDRERGFITLRDRRGNLYEFPLMSLSIAVITNEKREIEHIAQVDTLAAELKKYAKSLPGSNYVKDRRKEDSTPKLPPTTGPDQNKSTKPGHNLVLDELSLLLKNNKLNIFLQPVVDIRDKSIVGYEALFHGFSKSGVIKQEKIFTQAIDLKYEKEIIAVYFDKLNLFCCGLKKPLWISGWVHPRILHKILIEESQLWEKCDINEAFTIQMHANEILQYDQIIKEIIPHLQEKGVAISIIPPISGALPLKDLSTIKPQWIHMKEDYIKMWQSNPSNITMIKAIADMATLFGGKPIISGVDTNQMVEELQKLGIFHMAGDAVAKSVEKLKTS